jgi:hypothetical protein
MCIKDLGVASHKIDPPADDVDFRGCHDWIRKGETDAHWTRGRRLVLNRLSALAVKTYGEDVFDPESRFEWAHLAVNAFASNEAVNLGQAYLYDVLRGRSMGPYNTVSI